MLASPTGLAGATDHVDKPVSRARSVEVSSTEVLITTQQVLFSTAAAVGVVHRGNVGGRLVAILRRMFATSTEASRPRPRYCPRRPAFLENAAMARAMDRS